MAIKNVAGILSKMKINKSRLLALRELKERFHLQEFVFRRKGERDYRFSLVCPRFCQFSAGINKLSLGAEYKNFCEIFIADSEVASHLYRFTIYVTGNFSVSPVVGAERVSQYRRHPGHIKNVDEC